MMALIKDSQTKISFREKHQEQYLVVLREDTGSLYCTSYNVSQTNHPDTNSFLEYLLDIMYSFFKAHILRVEKFNTYTKYSITNFCVLITQLQYV